jgi:hypothetical protein
MRQDFNSATQPRNIRVGSLVILNYLSFTAFPSNITTYLSLDSVLHIDLEQQKRSGHDDRFIHNPLLFMIDFPPHPLSPLHYVKNRQTTLNQSKKKDKLPAGCLLKEINSNLKSMLTDHVDGVTLCL